MIHSLVGIYLSKIVKTAGSELKSAVTVIMYQPINHYSFIDLSGFWCFLSFID